VHELFDLWLHAILIGLENGEIVVVVVLCHVNS
jgi:hypothetical protein